MTSTEPIHLETLLQEMEELKKNKADLENELKKRLANENKCKKRYYEKNKEEIQKKGNDRLKRLQEENPDKLREYRRRAYLKMKEKKKLAKESQNI
jgi:hypothetical protein